jgi:hypothetical protein
MKSKQVWVAVTVSCCAVGYYLRWLNAHADLGSPGIDENDVVQQAVALMGREWRYRQFGYGALPMYALAGLYRVVGWLHGLRASEYAQRVFFDGAEQYLLARLFCAACYLPVAIASYRVLASRFGRVAGAVSACLLASPCVDELTHAFVRVDMAQGACQVGAVLFLVWALDDKRSWGAWIGAGICTGFAVACKPLPGLLVLPCLFAASWFASESEVRAVQAGSLQGAASWKASLIWFGARCLRTLARPRLWAALVAAVVAQFIANPSSLELRAFVAGQFETASYYSGPRAPGAHLTPFEALEPLGWPFCAAAALSVLLLPFVRDVRARFLGLFPLLYVTAFWGRPVRAYYMAAPAAAFCVLIGACVGIVLCGLGWDTPTAAAPGAPGTAAPSVRAQTLSGALGLGALIGIAWIPSSSLDDARSLVGNITRARNWIYEHVPTGTAMFHFGRFSHGPRLVTSHWNWEAKWADFFDFGRRDYPFYRAAAEKAYEEYRRQGRPWYALEGYGYLPEPARALRKPWLSERLAQRASQRGQQYIILAGFRTGPDYRELGYSWFDQVELAQQFGDIAIFRVPPAAPPSDAAAPDAALAGAKGSGG